MLCGKINLIRLCWIVSVFVSFVECQSDGNGFGGNGFGGGSGRFGPPVGFGVGPPFPNGGFGRGGFNRGSQGFPSRPNQSPGQAQNRKPEQVDQRQEDEVPEQRDPAPVTSSTVRVEDSVPAEAATSTPAAPSSTIADAIETLMPAIDANDELAIGLPPRSSFVFPLSSLRAAIPTPDLETLRPIVSSDEPSTLIGAPVQATSTFVSPGSLSALIPSPAATTTMTTAVTVLVTPTPAPESESPPAAGSTASSTNGPDATPVSASASEPMSSSAKAGMGVGITFGIIGLASVTGFYLWRRRRNINHDNTDSSPSPKPNLGRFLLLHRGKNTPTDTEWSIESAEKVEIVRGANARTLSRSDSSSSPPTRDGVLKVGMTFEQRRDAHPALTSNPPSLPEEGMLSPSAFPRPPTGTGTGNGNGATGSGDGRTGSWPLSG